MCYSLSFMNRNWSVLWASKMGCSCIKTVSNSYREKLETVKHIASNWSVNCVSSYLLGLDGFRYARSVRMASKKEIQCVAIVCLCQTAYKIHRNFAYSLAFQQIKNRMWIVCLFIATSPSKMCAFLQHLNCMRRRFYLNTTSTLFRKKFPIKKINFCTIDFER